jgi:hypothetical protein
LLQDVHATLRKAKVQFVVESGAVYRYNHSKLCGRRESTVITTKQEALAMNMIPVWLVAGIAAAVILGGGCAKQCEKPINKICTQGVDRQAAMAAAQRTLENMHFTIEKADANAGYISTRPLVAGQFFELWRSDTVGCENFAEANLHSVTRVAEIDVNGPDGEVCIKCKVATRRLSMPQREVNSATELPSVFSKSSAGLQTLKLDQGQQKATAWVDMGPDANLQTRILERIKKQIEK